MTREEADTIGEILGAPRITERFADLTKEVPGLAASAATIDIPKGSPYDDRTLGDTRARTLTGASVVAVVRGRHVIASPSPSSCSRTPPWPSSSRSSRSAWPAGDRRRPGSVSSSPSAWWPPSSWPLTGSGIGSAECWGGGRRAGGPGHPLRDPRRAREVLEPLRDLFAAIFFLSFGLTVETGAVWAALPAAALLALVTTLTKGATGWYAARRDGVGIRRGGDQRARARRNDPGSEG